MYVNKDEYGNIDLISLYVDDFIIIGSVDRVIASIIEQLFQVFGMKDLGQLHYYLGFDVWRDKGKTLITQGKYTLDILKRFRMNECKEVYTPLMQNEKLSNNDESNEVDGTLY